MGISVRAVGGRLPARCFPPLDSPAPRSAGGGRNSGALSPALTTPVQGLALSSPAGLISFLASLLFAPAVKRVGFSRLPVRAGRMFPSPKEVVSGSGCPAFGSMPGGAMLASAVVLVSSLTLSKTGYNFNVA